MSIFKDANKRMIRMTSAFLEYAMDYLPLGPLYRLVVQEKLFLNLTPAYNYF